MFSHYLITRFNVVVKDSSWKTTKGGNSVHTDSWLMDRFSLFEKYTLPSIKHQSCKNFKWLVLFNSETPGSFKERIMTYSAEVHQFMPIYVAPYTDATEIIQRYIQADNSKDYVITTRIDNDDMIHRDYLKRVQELFRVEENLFISFRYGIQYSEKNNTICKYNFIRNHYTSRIEKQDNLKTILNYNHTQIHLFDKLLTCNDEYMWVEIVHSGNLINNEMMFKMVNLSNTDLLYGVTLPHSRVNKLSFAYFLGAINYYISPLKENIRMWIDKRRS